MEGFARRRSRRFGTTDGMDSALKVIELIPRNQDQDAVWHLLKGSLCEHEDGFVSHPLGSQFRSS